jgi:hypothetical protein
MGFGRMVETDLETSLLRANLVLSDIEHLLNQSDGEREISELLGEARQCSDEAARLSRHEFDHADGLPAPASTGHHQGRGSAG